MNCTRVVGYEFVSLINIVDLSTEIYIGLASTRWAQPGLSVTQRWHTRTPPLHRAAEGFLQQHTRCNICIGIPMTLQQTSVPHC